MVAESHAWAEFNGRRSSPWCVGHAKTEPGREGVSRLHATSSLRDAEFCVLLKVLLRTFSVLWRKGRFFVFDFDFCGVCHVYSAISCHGPVIRSNVNLKCVFVSVRLLKWRHGIVSFNIRTLRFDWTGHSIARDCDEVS